MTRLPRILLNTATAVSLALCLTVVVLWARSYAITDDVLCYGSNARVHRWWSSNGRIIHLSAPDLTGGKQAGWRHGPTPPLIYGEEHSETEVPYWLLCGLVLCAGVAPSLVRNWRKAQSLLRARNFLCPACGYDLRATPARCPECGALPPPRPPP